jgi:hypothetical protein
MCYPTGTLACGRPAAWGLGGTKGVDEEVAPPPPALLMSVEPWVGPQVQPVSLFFSNTKSHSSNPLFR